MNRNMSYNIRSDDDLKLVKYLLNGKNNKTNKK